VLHCWLVTILCSSAEYSTTKTIQYPIIQTIINLYFHPLSKFPGPKLWAASRLPFIYCLLTGKLVKREREFHERYGEIIRLAPDEISFANEEAWNEIYSFRPGHKRAVRDKAYYVGRFPLLSITGITVLSPR